MGILLVQGLSLPFLLKDSSSDILLISAFFKAAYADHGQEITITLHNSSFGSLTSGGGNQISAFASYELNDDSIAGQTINAVMEVNAPNGTLIRTSSYPNGFIAQTAGGVEGLETTIRDPTIQSVIANVTFRNLEKTAMLSNDLRVNLNLADEGTAITATEDGVGLEGETLGLDSGSEQASGPPDQTEQEEGGEDAEEETENEEQDEGQELPLPLFGGG
jgi:hypothetical protein